MEMSGQGMNQMVPTEKAAV